MPPRKPLPWKAAAVLTAGAPTSPLMAGALAAVYDRGHTYDWIFTSGSGSFIGLSLVAPKNGTPSEALRGLIDLMVSDPVYQAFPVNHKVFFKAGPWSELFRRLNPYFQMKARTPFSKMFNDWVSLVSAAAAPTTLNYFSKGLCNPNPWIEDFVDFKKLRAFKGGFTVNAYNITTASMKYFQKDQLTADHLRAATACPFIYPPFRLKGDYYYEGADIEPINFPILRVLAKQTVKVDLKKQPIGPKRTPTRDTLTGNVLRFDQKGERLQVVVFDVLGSLKPEALVRLPRNILDAYAISLTTPLKSLVQTAIQTFDRERLEKNEPVELEVVTFDIPERYWPYVLDWTDSNAKRLWKIGYDRGNDLVDKLQFRLPPRETDNASPRQQP
jgi:predicted acylesterase/phospholipase RssA